MNTLMESWPRRHRITVDEYHRMAEVGLFAPDARVELVEGEIIDMAPIGVDHNGVVNQLLALFAAAVGRKGVVQVQGAIRLDQSTELQPDVAICMPRGDFYRTAHPAPADILLIVEVSDSTLGYDRDVKLPLYARHGIPEAWIVDLRNGELRVYRSPDRGAWREQRVTAAPGVMSLLALPGVEVDLAPVFKG